MPGKLVPRISLAAQTSALTASRGSATGSGGIAPPTPPDVLTVTRDLTTNMDPYNKDMQWYSMFRMNDGRILTLAGGYHSPGSSVNSIRAYNPVTRTWATLKANNSQDPVYPNQYAPGTTDWFSTDNTISLFIASHGGGTVIQGNQVVYDAGNNAFLASDIKAFNASYLPDTVENYIDMPVDARTLAGYNAACAWCDALDYGISTTPVQSGNQNGAGDNRWFWIEKNSAYPGSSDQPLKTTFFEPPSTFTASNFYSADSQGFGGWVNNRNFCAMVGEYFYVGGGFVHTPAQDSQWSFRPNKRFFKIHLPTLKAATTDAEKVAAVTELAHCPVQAYYPGFSYDEARRKFLLFVDVGTGSNIYCYDVLTDAWSDVTPTSQIGAAPSYNGWTPFPIDGWMAVYDPVTDAHYVREGTSQNSTYLNTQYVYAGRMRKVQFNTAAPSRYTIATQTSTSTGQPVFWRVFNGMKHIALAYDNDLDEMIQCGGDYDSGPWAQPSTPQHPGPNPVYRSAGGKRDFWMCKPIANGTTMDWQNVQPLFMPYGQPQGPKGPDQVWWFQRTAVTPHEWWVMPGSYRGFQYEQDYGMLPELWGDAYSPMKWLRPGWLPASGFKRKRYIGGTSNEPFNPATDIGRQTDENDKFAAYDPVTDAAYCINDNFEIIKWDFGIMDWAITLLGSPTLDDDGNNFPNGTELSIGGSLQARVDRKIYALCGWFQSFNGPTRSYLAWYDIDAGTRGLIRLPFDIEPNYFVQGVSPPENFGVRNPEESTGLVALHRKLVMIRTYDTFPAGTPCIWEYDVDRRSFRQGEVSPTTIFGRGWCAIPKMNSVVFFGTVDEPNESNPNFYIYRCV